MYASLQIALLWSFCLRVSGAVAPSAWDRPISPTSSLLICTKFMIAQGGTGLKVTPKQFWLERYWFSATAR